MTDNQLNKIKAIEKALATSLLPNSSFAVFATLIRADEIQTLTSIKREKRKSDIKKQYEDELRQCVSYMCGNSDIKYNEMASILQNYKKWIKYFDKIQKTLADVIQYDIERLQHYNPTNGIVGVCDQCMSPCVLRVARRVGENVPSHKLCIETPKDIRLKLFPGSQLALLAQHAVKRYKAK